MFQKRPDSYLTSLALLMTLTATDSAWAAEPKSDASAQALKKAQGMLRELSQQKTQLETDNAKLLEQNKALEGKVKELDTLRGELDKNKSSLEGLKANAGALEGQLSSERDKYHSLMEKHRQVVEQAKKIQSDNLLLVGAVKEREDWIGQCGKNNSGLQTANKELLEKYKQKGFWDRVGELEPFTGIGKVSSETAEQDYRHKLQDLQVTPFKSETQAVAQKEKPADTAPADDDEDE